MKDLLTKIYYTNEKNPKYKIGDKVRTANLRKTLAKRGTTHWSLRLYNFSEIVNYNMPNYRIDFLSERYNEAWFKAPKLTLNENNVVMKALNLLSFNLLSTITTHRPYIIR